MYNLQGFSGTLKLTPSYHRDLRERHGGNDRIAAITPA
jgi:hypothetical protein